MSNTIDPALRTTSVEQPINGLASASDESVNRMDAELNAVSVSEDEQAAVDEGIEMFAVNLLMGTMRGTSEAFNEIGTIDSSVEPDWMPDRADDEESEV